MKPASIFPWFLLLLIFSRKSTIHKNEGNIIKNFISQENSKIIVLLFLGFLGEIHQESSNNYLSFSLTRCTWILQLISWCPKGNPGNITPKKNSSKWFLFKSNVPLVLPRFLFISRNISREWRPNRVKNKDKGRISSGIPLENN